MRVIIFTYYFPKIAETFILNRITRLIDSGVDVRIFALKNPSIVKAKEDISLETIFHPDVVKYRLMDLVTYFPKKPNGEMDFMKIKSAVKNFNPDVVHIQWGNLGEELFSGMNFVAPTSVSFHSCITPTTWNIKNSGFSKVFEKATIVLPVSNFIKNGLIGMGCDSNKIIVHHMGVDTELFAPLDGIEKQTVEILSVGSFIEKKGFQDALEAIGLLSENNITVKYKLIGEGPLKSDYVKIIEKYNLIKNVAFTGKLTQDKVIEEYQKADIYLHPSVTSSQGDDEGIPTAIMEAQSCGLPVVSTLHTGIPELVKDNITGFLSNEHDCSQIAKSIETLVSNKELRKRMGSKGREVVLTCFDVNKLNKEMIDIYKGIHN